MTVGRRAVASIICPSAPFLVPLRARSTYSAVRFSPPIIHARNASVATQQKKKPAQSPRTQSKFLRQLKHRRKLEKKQQPRAPESSNDIDCATRFRDALKTRRSGETTTAIKLYPEMVDKTLLTSGDMKALCQALHQHCRIGLRRGRNIDPEIDFGETIIKDMRERTAPPDPWASLHLLSLLKEAKRYDRALAFWDWLQHQSDDYVNASVYGAAIEMLAYHGHKTLEDLEELYETALSKFPGQFLSYHLSPEAILPDRSQHFHGADLHMLLLQGITVARVLMGDWRNAYVGLDVALRLSPDKVPRYLFETFIHERPLAEAYAVFMLACRAGIAPPTPTASRFLASLTNKILGISMSRKIDFATKVELAQGVFRAVKAYVGAGGRLDGPLLSALLKPMVLLLYHSPTAADAAGSEPPGEGEIQEVEKRSFAFNRRVAESARQFLIDLAHAGAKIDNEGPLNSVATIGGRAGCAPVVRWSIESFDGLNITPSDVLYRNTLLAAGHLGEQRLVRTSWELLVEAAEDPETDWRIESRDWEALVRACKRVGMIDYVDEQVAALPHTLTKEGERKIEQAKKAKLLPIVFETAKDAEEAKVLEQVATTGLESLREEVKGMKTVLGRPNGMHDFAEEPVWMHLRQGGTPTAVASARETLRDVYEELSTDPATHAAGQAEAIGDPMDTEDPEAAADVATSTETADKLSEGDAEIGIKSSSEPQRCFIKPEKPMSSTGFTLDALRFENWFTITELLAMAEAREAKRQTAIDKAIKSGKPVADEQDTFIIGPAVAGCDGQVDRQYREMTRDEWKQEALRLRGIRQGRCKFV